MKLLLLLTLCVLSTVARAFMLSSLAAATLFSLNRPAVGFFGIFRRRKSNLPPAIQETATAPEGPISFPSGFPAFPGFGSGGNFFPGYNIPGFGSIGQNIFQPSRPSQFTRQPPFASQSFPQQQHQMPNSAQGMQFNPEDFASEGFDSDAIRGVRGDDVPPGMNAEEAESFFTLLAETDESKCISRLVCEMGANPDSGGEFGQTVVDIIGSLTDFPAGSRVSEYNEVLSTGRNQGLSACLNQFSACDEESYQLVRKAQVEDERSSNQ